MKILRYAVAMVLMQAAGSSLWAQAGEAERLEFIAYTGALTRIGNTHPQVGGILGYSLGRNASYILDTNYSPLGTNTVRTHTGENVTHSRLYNISFSVHIKVPITQKFEPYAILGGALLLNNFQTRPGGDVILSHWDQNFGFQTGGGLRYYVKKQWGVIPEARVTISNKTYMMYSIGFFYQIPFRYF